MTDEERWEEKRNLYAFRYGRSNMFSSTRRLAKADHLRYVVGFMFNLERTEVILIRKDHPDWQAGKLNGIGGHVEPNETTQEAMVREFREEAGVQTIERDWNIFLVIEGADYSATFLRAFSDSYIKHAKTMTSEEVYTVPVNLVMIEQTVPHVPWIVPLAMDMTMRTPIYCTSGPVR